MLLDKIKADQLVARKAKDGIKASLLTTLYSEAINVGKNDGNRLSTDEEVIGVIKRFMKSANENKHIYTESHNELKLMEINNELDILSQYLPQTLTEDEIKLAIENLFKNGFEQLPSEMGKIMKQLKVQYGTALDGNTASKVLRSLLY